MLGRKPDEWHDARLAGVIRESARQLLARGVEAEVRHFREAIARPANGNGNGRDPLVRNGLHPERTVMTGVGPVPVRLPKVRRRDRTLSGFRSALVVRYARRTGSWSPQALESYLRGIESGQLCHALGAIVGPQAHALPQEIRHELQQWWAEQCSIWRNELAQLDTPNLTCVASAPIVAEA